MFDKACSISMYANNLLLYFHVDRFKMDLLYADHVEYSSSLHRFNFDTIIFQSKIVYE